jgi:hypothetical protein
MTPTNLLHNTHDDDDDDDDDVEACQISFPFSQCKQKLKLVEAVFILELFNHRFGAPKSTDRLHACHTS